MTKKEEANIVKIKLLTPEPTENSLLEQRTVFLSNIIKHEDLVFFGLLGKGVQKSEELLLYKDLEPLDDKGYLLELAVELPFFLPDLNEKSEYWIDLRDEEADKRNDNKEVFRTIYISNEMAEAKYFIEEKGYNLTFPRNQLKNIYLDPFDVPQNTYIKILKSFVSSQFRIKGNNPDEAMKNELWRCVDFLMKALNSLLLAISSMSELKMISAPIVFDYKSFEYFYFSIVGKGNLSASGRVSLAFNKIPLTRQKLNEEKTEKFISYVRGTSQVDDIHRIMMSANSYLEGNLLEYALLQFVIAAETLTTRYIHKRFISKGVSSSNLKNYKSDITYSQMLNIHLFVLTPSQNPPSRDLIGIINKARIIRNKIMHEGEFNETRETVLEIKEATELYLKYLREIDNN